jgi:hypothetical protein
VQSIMALLICIPAGKYITCAIARFSRLVIPLPSLFTAMCHFLPI